MSRPVTLFTGQWADLSLNDLAPKIKEMGYDGAELACWGDHFDVQAALNDPEYVSKKWKHLEDNGLTSYAISNNLVGQAVCDNIDERHAVILTPEIYDDGDPGGVRLADSSTQNPEARLSVSWSMASPVHPFGT